MRKLRKKFTQSLMALAATGLLEHLTLCDSKILFDRTFNIGSICVKC